jgi:DNA-binding XRE family transcriptional regulator
MVDSPDDKDRPRDAGKRPGARTQEVLAPMPPKSVDARLERGRRIKAARKRAGLTQKELADRVGVGREAIAKIETGARRASMDLGLSIARELGESAEALFGGGR